MNHNVITVITDKNSERKTPKARHYCALAFLASLSLLTACSQAPLSSTSGNSLAYIPVDIELHQKVLDLDTEFFTAYNQCDIKKQSEMMADDIEFLHDRTGLETSKQRILDSTQKYICNKVTRTLLTETVEVYPIKDYGAIQIGYHKFFNRQEPDAISKPSKFISYWRKDKDKGKWVLAKVVSLH